MLISIITLLFCLASAIVAAVVITKQVNQPIQLLTDGVASVEERHFEPELVADLAERPDEIGHLVHSFVDMVSKNGNLLLNVGPMADGTIPNMQQERLQGLGRWLEVNGEATFGTRPWKRAEGHTTGKLDVRFTQQGEALYVILLAKPRQPQVTIESLRAGESVTVHLLGHAEALAWRQQGEHLAITLPDDLAEAPAYALRITPRPE